jgi:cytochrome c5
VNLQVNFLIESNVMKKIMSIGLISLSMGLAAASYADEQIKAIEKRIQPVGKVNIAGESLQQAVSEASESPTDSAASNNVARAEEIYSQACAVCHVNGVAGAPKFGDAAAWNERLVATGEAEYEQQVLMLLSSVINGKGAMPARGTCMNCSDEELLATVRYMLAAE